MPSTREAGAVYMRLMSHPSMTHILTCPHDFKLKTQVVLAAVQKVGEVPAVAHAYTVEGELVKIRALPLTIVRTASCLAVADGVGPHAGTWRNPTTQT